jgi:sugar transferase EpsL
MPEPMSRTSGSALPRFVRFAMDGRLRWAGVPLLFRQPRIGLHGKPFMLYKLKTMRDPLPGEDPLATDAIRITRLGRFLRATSLDELPSLWNVLKGDMALVGPRPLLPEYVPLYTPEQMRRHEVKPGITGWAQVNGRNAISWEEKFRLDVWYVDNRSFWLDLKILRMTLWQVLARKNVSAANHVTMPPFKRIQAAATSEGEC